MTVGRAILGIGLLALLYPGIARAQDGQSSLVVALSERSDQKDLVRLRKQLGITETLALPSINSEIWKVPDEKVQDVFRRAARNSAVDSLDYRGSDYRSLFVGVPANMDMTPAQSALLQQIRANPRLKDAQVVRLRAGEIPQRMLTQGFGTADQLPQSGGLTVDLRPGLKVSLARRLLNAKSSSEFQWSGAVATIPDPAPGPMLPATGPDTGDAALALKGDKILGVISVGADSYAIRPLAGGLHVIARIDPAAFPPEHPPAIESPVSAPSTQPSPPPPDNEPVAPDVAPGQGNAAAADAPPPRPAELAIGVAYTREAGEGIRRDMNTEPEQLIEAAILRTNEGFAQSGISGRLKLAGTRVIDGQETGDFDSMIAAVVSPADGAFDALHGWRKTIKANAVVVLVSMNTYCGMAAGIQVPRKETFAIVNYGCAVDNLSFPHEFGHLLGARHDPDTDPAEDPPLWSHGYRYGNVFRTIMAYAGGACTSCPRINRWANPTLQFNGVPLGTFDRNYDARVIQEMLPVYEKYFGD